MRFITFCLAVLCTSLLATGLTAQNLRPSALVEQATATQSSEETFDIFTSAKSSSFVKALDEVGADYTVFELSETGMNDLRKSAPDRLELTIPGGIGKVDLVRADIFADGFRVTESGSNSYNKSPLGLHYRGIVSDDKTSLVAVSIFEDELSGMIATNAGNFVLGKMSGKDEVRHVIYNDHDLPAPDLGVCETPDSNIPYSPKDLIDLDPSQKDANNCVNLYLEADYSIFQQRGSVANVTSFLTGLFNQVAVLYANENINLVLSELYVWSSQDPFNANSSSDNLSAFRSTRTNFNGDIAHLVSFQASGGVAYVNVLCAPSYAYGFSSIDNNYNAVPSYSWSVNVLAHELGHNFGSQHTHACVWNNNNTAIDGCYATEGGCSSSVGLPSGGGTIMSYCHLTSAGVNLNNGFGTQPGNLIRNRAYSGSCLTSCSTGGGGDNGGGDNGTNCTENEVTVTIRTDNYPGETAWTLTNSAGSTVASGGGYSQRNTSYTEEFCLEDDCYTFTITDTYGDGICCSYGNGAYTINLNGTDVATGGNFTTSTTEQFCANTSDDGGGSGGGGGDTSCDALDFQVNVPTTYGGNQDKGNVTVLSNSTGISIQNNAWKDVMIDYTVTPNTVLEFEFGSSRQGEIHGIGFDNNNTISSNYAFQLFGTQTWGYGDFKDYNTIGNWKAYSIPVGQYYTGTFDRIFFVCDHDGAPRNGNSYFRNIRIYEGAACVALIPGNEPIIPQEETLVPAAESLDVFPNPASSIVNLNLAMVEATVATVQVIDMTGRTVRNMEVSLVAGEQRVALPVNDFPAGTYFVRLNAASGYSATTKFTVAR
ncbi:T9SS type A sorting domain-containing protein [Neolewinella aurantiaca]|uniref:T9SS type A sorting domain-containing protein n=1 Tax=Neolewinella aurantiaca TaxID=2602767 RepID=A0A5C7FIU0_9BACT|nr:M12 family metallo-peptidase [Neolewinella aurantiaca]TXF89781.1 T9SS type A sorting domain-containing protein [Neolewinella aurantiaca]